MKQMTLKDFIIKIDYDKVFEYIRKFHWDTARDYCDFEYLDRRINGQWDNKQEKVICRDKAFAIKLIYVINEMIKDGVI